MSELRVIPVAGLPEFTEGISVGAEIAARAELIAGDVVVISQKIVSKAEGRLRRLSSVIPGGEACKNDWQLVEKLRRCHFLFLGYELQDWNVRVILHRIWGEQKVAAKS